MTSHASFLEVQTEEYQGHATRLMDLKLALEHQQTIQSNKAIPKQYRPKQLKTFDSTLSQEFNQKYSTLFFQQLDRVITSNTIKLKLTECTMTSIVPQTELYLSRLTLSTEDICSLHDKFLSDIPSYTHTTVTSQIASEKRSKYMYIQHIQQKATAKKEDYHTWPILTTN